jgi:hypothetical protein
LLSASSWFRNLRCRWPDSWSRAAKNAPPITSGQALASAFAIGIAVRLPFVLLADFPLNDGGLFYVMVRDLQAAGYALPAFTSYSGGGIPYAYPPFTFYLAGVLDSLGLVALVDSLRFLPLLANILTILAVASLAHVMLRSRVEATATVYAFVLLPHSFQWSIMGGGLTRSFGFLFAILALGQLYRFYLTPGRRRLTLTTLLSTLAVLSHLEMGWYLAFSSALLWVAFGRDRNRTAGSFVIAAGVLTLSAPWWFAVVARHGIAPFVAAFTQTGSPIAGFVRILTFSVTSETALTLIGGLAALGLAVSLLRGDTLLPAWLLVTFLLDPRSAQATAAPIIAMLAAIGMVRIVLPHLNRQAPPSDVHSPIHPPIHSSMLGSVILSAVLVYTAVMVFMANWPLLQPLARSERDAMEWIRANTSASSIFLTVGTAAWAADSSAEWFPAIANRRNLATVQGTEWLPRHADQVVWSGELLTCSQRGTECLDAWARLTALSWTHVYLPHSNRQSSPLYQSATDDSLWTLRNSLRRDLRYEVIYDGVGATVFRRLEGL